MTRISLLLALVCGVTAAQDSLPLYTLREAAVLEAEGYEPLDLRAGLRVQLVSQGERSSVIKVRGVHGALVGKVPSTALRAVERSETAWGDPMQSLLPPRLSSTFMHEDPIVVSEYFDGEWIGEMRLTEATPVTTDRNGGSVLFTLRKGDTVQLLGVVFGKDAPDNAWYVYARGATGYANLPRRDWKRVDPQAVLRRAALSGAEAAPTQGVPAQGPGLTGILNGASSPETAYTITAHDQNGRELTGHLRLRTDQRYGWLNLETPKGPCTLEGELELVGESTLRARWSSDYETVWWIKLQLRDGQLRGKWQRSELGSGTQRGDLRGTRED